MQLGMIGLGRMGANMTERLLRQGHEVVVYDRNTAVVADLVKKGAVGASSLAELVQKLTGPRALWLMVPAAVVDALIAELEPLLSKGDTLIDGGNSHYQDDIRRAKQLQEKGIYALDVGTSGGVWGAERGYCLMIGGDKEQATRLDPIFKSLAPGFEAASRTVGRTGPVDQAEQGYLYCGKNGAGHFVKMVHNGIEYGVMAAYAEGFALLNGADAGTKSHASDAETAPLKNPEHYQYDFHLESIAEVWRRGSVIASWLLDLTSIALVKSPQLSEFAGRVSDSGEGRWTVNSAVDIAVPVPVLSAALFSRFSSRGEGDFGNKLLSAMRREFGGHHEKTNSSSGSAPTKESGGTK